MAALRKGKGMILSRRVAKHRNYDGTVYLIFQPAEEGGGGALRMMADGSAEFTHAAGLTLDLTARGMGVRSQRYSMLVDNGVVKSLNIEGPGKFEVSDADTLLEQARELAA